MLYAPDVYGCNERLVNAPLLPPRGYFLSHAMRILPVAILGRMLRVCRFYLILSEYIHFIPSCEMRSYSTSALLLCHANIFQHSYTCHFGYVQGFLRRYPFFFSYSSEMGTDAHLKIIAVSVTECHNVGVVSVHQR